MKFTETKLKGAFIIEPELLNDERGFFTRTFCQKEFKDQGLNPKLVQCSLSYTKYKRTLRGMHYQVAPKAETKLVRCTHGSIYDVIIDLRVKSPSYCQWISVELNAQNRKMLYIPAGFAHGFQTLENDTEVFYQMSEFYAPSFAKGIRWNDPMFKIYWPLQDPILSKKDQFYDDFNDSRKPNKSRHD